MTRPDDTTPTAPVEGKVTAQWIGHALGLALAGFVSWALGVVCWHAPADAAHAPLAAAAVPSPVLGLVALIPLGVGFLFGYRAKHSPRPADAIAGELVTGPDLQAMITDGVLTALAERLGRANESADAALAWEEVPPAHGPETSADRDSTAQDGTDPAAPSSANAVRGGGHLTRNPFVVGEQGPTWATVKDGKVTPIGGDSPGNWSPVGGTTAGFPLDPDATGPIVADVIGTPHPADTSGT